MKEDKNKNNNGKKIKCKVIYKSSIKKDFIKKHEAMDE